MSKANYASVVSCWLILCATRREASQKGRVNNE